MKTGLCFICFVVVLLAVALPRSEGYKNVSSEAQTIANRITTKILPSRAICVRNAQCQSGICVGNRNESLFGYCK